MLFRSRGKKPFPSAADLNWPLTDMLIEKLKPYYIQQVFANEQLANFYALSRNLQPFNGLAAAWFDYRFRHRTNFEFEIISVVDYMLMTGKGICKLVWCEDEKIIKLHSVDPVQVIVPTHTDDLASADWVVQVHRVSKAAYLRNPNWKQGDEFVARLLSPSVSPDEPGRKIGRAHV